MVYRQLSYDYEPLVRNQNPHQSCPGATRWDMDDFHFLDRWQQVVVMRLRTGHNRHNARMFKTMKLAPPPTCNCSPGDLTVGHNILQRCPLLQTGRLNKYVVNSSPVTHQTLRQKGGSGEDSHIHLADWTFSVAVIEKKKKPLAIIKH